MTGSSPSTLDAAIYAEYTAWKQWGQFLECSELDRLRFEGDFAGLPMAGKTLFELGFGTGALLAWARAQGATVVGCELTEDSRAAARAHDISLIEGDFLRPGALPAEGFDYVVAFDVFEHLPAESIRTALFALAAALRPGGMIVLRYPNGQSPFGLTAQHGDITHKVALSRMIIEQLALGSGLETVRYASATYARRPGFRHRVISFVRAALRAGMIRLIQLAFATDIPLDAVMLHVLQKPRIRANAVQPR